MKYTAVIVEDEPLALKTLRDMLAGVDWLAIVGEAADGLAAVELINLKKPDLVFLDIHLPELSGLEVLKRLIHEPAIIFTTAHDRHAIVAFELAALDYLLKPFGRARLQQALDRARSMLGSAGVRPTLADAREALGKPGPDRLLIRDSRGIMPVAIRDIERIEAEGDYVAVRARGRTVLVHLPLGEMEERMDPTRFLRIHRSHLVNLDYVEAIEAIDNSQLQVKMKDGTRIAASRAASKRLRDLAL